MAIKVICLTLLVPGFAQSAVLPVGKCKLDDSACLKTAFQKMVPVFTAGMPDNKVEVLDPMVVDDFNFNLSGFKLTLKDGDIKGLKGAVIDSVEWDTKKKAFTMNYHLDNTITGHYIADGRILVLPITGDGQAKMKLKNLQIKLKIHYDIVKGTDGKDHVKPKKYDVDFEVVGNANYYLTNLFNGNKELSDLMLTFMNENWKLISDEFGRPLIEVATKRIFKNIIKFFDALPLEDIAIV